MVIHKLTLGVFAANCYIIETAQKNALLIDAGAEPERILRFLKENELRAKILTFTHGHFDHIGAASAIKDASGAKTMLPKEDRFFFLNPGSGGDIFPSYDGYRGEEPDILLSDGDEIVLDEVCLTVLHTPGHTPGSASCAETASPSPATRSLREALGAPILLAATPAPCAALYKKSKE